MRPTFDSIYMNLAVMLSAKSTCARLHVGCVVVSADYQRVLSIGYNGNWKGGPNKCDSKEPGNCGCLHAEDNAMIKLNPYEQVQKIAYVTTAPCLMCAKRFINAGVCKVVYLYEYRKTEGIDLLKEAGTEVYQVNSGQVSFAEDEEE